MPIALYLFVGMMLLLTVIPVWITISDGLESRKDNAVPHARWELVGGDRAKSFRFLCSPSQTTKAATNLSQLLPCPTSRKDSPRFIAEASGPLRIRFPQPSNFRRTTNSAEPLL